MGLGIVAVFAVGAIVKDSKHALSKIKPKINNAIPPN